MATMTRRDFLRTSMAAGACLGISSAFPNLAFGEDEGKYNVLFLVVDDLRPTLGCYGAKTIKTPNIDALAARGIIFNHAYCQQALCSPTRTSLLTGLRPDTTKVYNLVDHFRRTIPDVVTLPQYFKNHGYHSQGLSKIYHIGMDDAESWSVPHWAPGDPLYFKPETIAERKKQADLLRAKGIKQMPKGPAWEDPDLADNVLPDGRTADKAIETLREIKDKRFFLAVGFHRPHLPFVAPKKYFDMYPADKMDTAKNPFAPKDCPEIALHNFGELRGFSDIPDVGPLDEQMQKQLIRAYYAAASYTDAQIGRVVGEMEKLGLREKTIIVLWGDHGWHLGEHGLWCKMTDFEEATRAPLIFSIPGQKDPGSKSDSLVEFVDVYPTLCELAGLPVPNGLEGTSMVPVIKDPKRPWKKAAFSQHPRPGHIMGYTIRTDRYRYTEWIKDGKENVGVELYDYEKDPQGDVNIAAQPESKELASKMAIMLHDGWKAALPQQ